MSSSDNIHLSKKNHREISDFLTQELVYDYYFDSLDSQTKEILTTKISDGRELQLELNRLKLADDYLKQLKNVRIKEIYVAELKSYESFAQAIEKRFKQTKLPAGLKWAVEGASAVGILILILSYLPFNKLGSFRWSFNGPSILARVDKDTKAGHMGEGGDDSTASSATTVAATDTTEKGEEKDFSFKDEGAKDEKKAEAPVKASEPTPTKDKSTTKTIAAAATAPAATTKPTTPAADSAPVDDQGPPRGLLYRADLKVVNAEAASAKISQKITELGGQKAGEVPIGWEKGKGNYYYHFTIPAAKIHEMEAFIGEYGKFNVTEEKHPRKIPANLRRYIFTVSEKQK